MMKLVVLSCLMAAASASAIIAPYAPLVYSAPLIGASNYRGPLSLAPGQPADVLGADGRPLDTLDVNLDRAAHYTAKALEPFHLLKKRSAAFIAPVSTYAVAHSPLITPASPIAYTAPLAAPFAPLSYHAAPVVHVLKKRSAGLIAPAVSRIVAPAPLITTTGAIAYSAPFAAAPYAPLTYAAPLAPWYKK
ncbi:hypothetical protein O3G_MSEX002229 [Manduca sexta]|uniref:Cuticle protein n=1 Tax=Manduca sexta TaxID=7130 RepID=A0A921YMQ2_MANSE|nr:hypothetical protein O3G_MSEX002229 [Manduca sexta]KAG6442262.1 hypothetical protein O3G_MSEX002229 [Manduca sexta]